MSSRKNVDHTEKNSVFHSIRFKIRLAVAINGIVLMIFSLWLLDDSMNYVERDLMDDRLTSDILYLRDELGENCGAEWNLQKGALYIGDTLLGDGTKKNANELPFYHCEEITGTFFYIFVRTYNDDNLSWVKSGNYQQGHYRRIAGTTKGVNGESLVGTYMDKKVANILEKGDGIYSSEANVNGRMIYCRYELLYDADNNIVGVISAGRSVEEMTELVRKQKTRGFILIVAVLAFMSAALGAIVFYIVSAVNKIKAQLRQIGTGVFPEEPLKLKWKDEMSDVAESINEMVDSLKENERIGAELSLATDIQAHMLPSVFPPFPEREEFDIYAIMDPAKEVGGDFYDFFMLDENNVAVVAADVSGKGVPAALFMVIAKTLIKNYAQSGITLTEVFSKVNQLLCEGNEAKIFVTAWMGVLNIESGKLTYVNAGHNPPLVKLGKNRYTYLKTYPCFVLAGREGIRYRQNELQMQPGDRLFLYTDGVTEATDAEKKLYGEDRLEEYLNRHLGNSIDEVLCGLREDIDRFVGEAEQFDDITMLIMEYKKTKQTRDITEREFEAEDGQLYEVMNFIEEELEKTDCGEAAKMQISVAAEEVFVNIAHYAYEGKKGKMKLGISSDNEWISLRFSDYGIPFNPLLKEDPDITLPAEKRPVGGLGILLVKKSMDDVQYKYENGQNMLTIRKRL